MIPTGAELWLLAGFILLGLELAAPGAFMMWIGLACLGDGLLTWLFRPPFPFQVLAFALFSAVSIRAGLALRRQAVPSSVNSPQSGLVGRSARNLGFVDGETKGELRVRVGDTDWPARLAEGVARAEISDWFDVVDVVGMVLIVRPKTF
jgi:membrane protein implicated in regulation of membrane protease activity